MGWTVLYIAFGIVALWLLGEVLLQYKARLRWRLVAFAGFLGVVVGVLMPNVIVIGIGAAAFAVGQTYVTLSFRRGFSTGWALGGSPGSSRRRRSAGASADRDPVLQVTGIDYGHSYDDPVRPGPSGPANGEATAAEATAVYEPQPLPDDTNQYGVYSDAHYAAEHRQDGGDYGQDGGDYGRGGGDYGQGGGEHRQDGGDYGQDGGDYGRGGGDYGQGGGEHGRGGGEDASHGGYSSGYTDAYPQGHGYQQAGGSRDTYAESYGYGSGQQYAAYAGSAAQGYEAYGSYGGQQQYTDPYAAQGDNETPPGGVWVPLQRDGDQVPPPEQPPQYGYDPGYRNDPDGQAYRQ
ncbi:hypothetical protein [Streptomyces sp. I6]|uniref:hypothetical protein n=1 Tax=Streptomyces sp. I6 TaxID=2483113 RepID=UPI000F448DDA|nr:hypothetical protein [Streptomyces sp. I6]RNL70798.1 hypothetical protein EBF04_06420 [Streptomyces sp. I6]